MSALTRSWPLFLAAVSFALAPMGCGGDADPDATQIDPPMVKAEAGQARPAESNAEPAPSAGLVGDRLSGYKPAVAAPAVPQEPSPFRFFDVVPGSAIDFKEVSGMTADRHFPTANGSGAAIFDYDGDGLLDIYFATCKPIDPKLPGPSNRLYKNLGGMKFKDATKESGLEFHGFNHGIVVGDVDNDGDRDIVLACWGQDQLFLNNGDGTFKNVTVGSGLDTPGWSSGGAFLDFDNDGDLDLYLSRYGDWEWPKDAEKWCGDTNKKLRMYCSPREIRTAKHRFFRNDGIKDGIPRFTNIYDRFLLSDDPATAKKGDDGRFKPGRDDGHGFGVAAADLNDDGKIDLYIANDQNPNFVFFNNGDGSFTDVTEISGAAYDEKGAAQAGMGVDVEDVDGDGKPEILVTNFANEYNTLYQNHGSGNFFDQTSQYGFVADSMPYVGWGCALADFDSDGWPDCFVANGHVDDNREGTEYPEPPLLHKNVPAGGVPGNSRRFKIATRDVGKYFDTKHVARGVAFGDLDNDGDIDIVVNHKDDAPAVLRNDTPRGDNKFIRLELTGTFSAREAIGAKVEITAGKRTIYRQIKGGCSMESSHDPRLTVGVGPVTEVEKVVIRWPRGAVTTLEHLPVDSVQKITEPKSGAETPKTAAK